MQSLNISKTIRIQSVDTQELPTIQNQDSAYIHISENLHNQLNENLNTNAQEILAQPGYVIQNIRENINHFIQSLSNQPAAHTIHSHTILVDKSESDIIKQSYSSIICNND